MYLLGSVHLMKPDAYPLPVVVETAFEASSRAVFEVDLGAEGTAEAALDWLDRGAQRVILGTAATPDRTAGGDTHGGLARRRPVWQ